MKAHLVIECELGWPWYCRALLWLAAACVNLALWVMPIEVRSR